MKCGTFFKSLQPLYVCMCVRVCVCVCVRSSLNLGFNIASVILTSVWQYEATPTVHNHYFLLICPPIHPLFICPPLSPFTHTLRSLLCFHILLHCGQKKELLNGKVISANNKYFYGFYLLHSHSVLYISVPPFLLMQYVTAWVRKKNVSILEVCTRGYVWFKYWYTACKVKQGL